MPNPEGMEKFVDTPVDTPDTAEAVDPASLAKVETEVKKLLQID